MWWNTACLGKQPVQTARTSFHCTPCIGSMQLAQGWGPILDWWSWWQPLLPPSAVLHLTLTLSASGSIVHLLAGPSSLMVSHLDIHQHQGLEPLEVQTWVSKKLAPKGGGGGLGHCRHLLPGWVHLSHSSLFPRCQAELHDSGCWGEQHRRRGVSGSLHALTRFVSMKTCRGRLWDVAKGQKSHQEEINRLLELNIS